MKGVDRRQLLTRATMWAGGVTLNSVLPSWAQSATPGLKPPLPTLIGSNVDLRIGHSSLNVDGRMGHAVTINGTVPGPLLRFKEGQTVRLSVTNDLEEETSIHWHGLLVPFQMDGVPGVAFPGIKPRKTFVYEFPIRQSGTYWYHSHSGLQEAEGHYGPIVIDPADAEPVAYDREHVIVLSDFSFMHPHMIFNRLKQQAGLFNYQKQTVASLLADKDQTIAERMQGLTRNVRTDPVTSETFARRKKPRPFVGRTVPVPLSLEMDNACRGCLLVRCGRPKRSGAAYLAGS